MAALPSPYLPPPPPALVTPQPPPSAVPPLQGLHPAAGQFLLGTKSPAVALLRTYQRLAVAVVQAAAPGTPPQATAAKQAALDALACRLGLGDDSLWADAEGDDSPPMAADDVATDGGEGQVLDSPAWQAAKPKAKSAAPQECGEGEGQVPDAARWAAAVDQAWRPATTLLPASFFV